MSRRFFTALAAVAAMTLTFCAKEPAGAPDPAQGGEPVPVSFSLNLRDALTKAAPEASDFDNASGEFILYAAAFSKTTGALISTSKIGGPGFQPVETVSAKDISVVLTLSKAQDYKVVFFAMREGAFEVNFAGNNVATFSYKGSLWANDAWLDAFYASVDVSSGTRQYDVTLKRPFAQLNVLVPTGNVPVGQTTFSSSMTVQAPASFNLYSGTAGTDLQELTFADNAISATPVGAYKTTHTWIGMNYVLVPASGSVTVSSFVESGMEEPVQIGAVPVRVNGRTNIVGSVYSLADAVFHVQIDSGMADGQEVVVEVGNDSGDEPSVTTGDASSVTSASATLTGSYEHMTDVRDYGFYWGLSSTALTNQTHLNSSANSAEEFSSPISSLNAGTTYFYQAYVQVLDGGQLKEYKGEVRSFSTAASAGSGSYRPYLENYEIPAISLKPGTTYGSGSEKSGCGYKWYNHETSNANQMVVTHTYQYNSTVYRNYTCLVDKTKKAPLWSAFVMNKDAYPDNGVGRTGSWTDDPAIPSGWQQSGVDQPYSRGQFVGSNYRQVNDDANGATFYRTNQAPQYQTSFSDGCWNSLENAVKANAPTGRDTLYVVVGVLYETSQMSSGVPIPSHFYKLLMKCSFNTNGEMTAAKGVAYLFTNEAHSGDKYTDAKFRTTIDAIEERTGFDFFANVPQSLQNAAEQQSASLW